MGALAGRGRVEVRLAGIGGQGIVLAGHILALGAFYDGRWVICTQAYSARVRGAPVEADVIIADRRVPFPFVRRPDILVALAEPAFRFLELLAEGALVLTDASLAQHVEGVRTRKLVLPIFEKAREVGSPALANMVALGALVASTGLVKPESMEKAISESVRPDFLEADLRAFRAGLELVGA